jgi:hypothetical protein
MTSLFVWTGVDSRKPSSVYIAADSRFSWQNSIHWDQGRKVFASLFYPDVLGYCGDVVSMSNILQQCTSLADRKLLYEDSASADSRVNAYNNFIEEASKSYPNSMQNSVVVGVARDGVGMKARFLVWELVWNQIARTWTRNDVEVKDQSGPLLIWGTGASSIRAALAEIPTDSKERTSRAMYWAFVAALKSGKDKFSGGAPQISGVYRQLPAKDFGVVFGGERFIYGVPVPSTLNPGSCEWFNEEFERCDGNRGLRLPEAQRQPRPKVR